MTKKFLYQALTECQGTKELIAIFTGEDLESYDGGYVEAVTENDVLLRVRRQDGVLEGWVALPLEGICKIETGTNDLKAVECYAKEYQAAYTKTFFGNDAPKRKHSIMATIIDYLYEKQEVATFEMLGGEDYTSGLIANYDAEGIKLQAYTEEGQPDGWAWITHEYITAIRFAGKTDQLIQTAIRG